MEKQSLPPLPMVHSDLDEYGLDPYEFRIYAHIVRRTGGNLDGECFAKLKKTAEICHMSVRKAQYALKTLCDAGLIIKEQRKGKSDIYRLMPKSNWKPKKELKQIRQNIKESQKEETALTVTTTGSTTPGVFFQPLIFNGDNQIIIL